MKTLVKLAAGLIAAAFISSTASAGNVVLHDCEATQGGMACHISLFGPIEVGDADKFIKVIEDNKIVKAAVWLNSPGGALFDGLRIGRKVKEMNFNTFVPNDSVCMSACATIWLAGSRRLYEPKAAIGFHAAGVRTNAKSKNLTTSTGFTAIVGAYLAELGLSDKAIFYLTNTPTNKIFWLNEQKAADLEIEIEMLPQPEPKTANRRR